MDAREKRFTELIKQEVQLRVPVYQRTYDWEKEQCKELLDDIVTLVKNKNLQNHFIGAIVYIEKGLIRLGSVNEFLIVDGQQRITTFMLIFAVIEEIAQESGKKGFAEQVRKQCLINQYADEQNLTSKLILTKPDDEIFHKAIDHEKTKSNSNITANYNFIRDYLKELVNGQKISLEEIYQTINGKIIVVAIALDKTKDNAQLIFESINSTGIDLTSGDLIRNFLLMNLENNMQNEVYSKYWYPMQESLKKNLTSFVLHYLYMKRGTTTNIRDKDVYKEYKRFFNENFTYERVQDAVSDLLMYSKYWLNIFDVNDEDSLVKSGLERLKKVESDTYYPFLLSVYNEYAGGKLKNEDFYKILRIIESFIVRRSICGVPTNKLNAIFRPMFNSLAHENLKDSLVDALRSKKWPNDSEFRSGLINGNLYNHDDFCKVVLEQIELFNNKEPVNLKTLEVEHIMPQANGEVENLSEGWKKMLGENYKDVYEKWLHTLGNLTLTGYNEGMRDSDFEKKKNMENGFKQSRLKLNQEIAKEASWNENTISSRGEHMADTAIRIWEY